MAFLTWLFRRSVPYPRSPERQSPNHETPVIRPFIDTGGPGSTSVTLGISVEMGGSGHATNATSERRHSFMEVVGESHYQPALQQLLARYPDRAVSVLLQPEPTNPYDSNAVAVLDSASRDTLGYLRRDVAKDYQAAIAAFGEIECPGWLIGGEDAKPTVGVTLDFAPVYALPSGESRRARKPESTSARTPAPPRAKKRTLRIPDAAIGFRLANELEGLLIGITADHVITPDEAARVERWSVEAAPYAHVQPFNDISAHLRAALADGELTLEECETLLFVVRKYTRANPYFDQMRSGLQVLLGLLAGLSTDAEIGDAEIRTLMAWVAEWSHLAGLWPYDEIHAIANAVLADGTVTSEEVQHLRALEQQFPIAGRVGETLPVLVGGVCAVSPRIVFDSKTFVLTGESSRSPRAEIESRVRHSGGIAEPRVTQRTDYLIVGADGSPYWAFACYGRKIERAYELRKEGHPVVIAHENDFWKAVDATSASVRA